MRECAKKALSESLEIFGNPSSAHPEGEKAHELLEEARRVFSSLLNAGEDEIFFTSGGTESDNISLIGCTEAALADGKDELVVSALEHSAVADTAQYLEKHGFRLHLVRPDGSGRIAPGDIEREINERTALVSVMTASNVTGVIQPFGEIGALCAERGVPFHSDAVQAFGKMPIDVRKSNIGLLSASAHKFGGPKGIGILYVSRKIRFLPLMHGGSQEMGKRPGTESIMLAHSAAEAAKEAYSNLASATEKVALLRDRIEKRIAEIEGSFINGKDASRLPFVVSAGFPKTESVNLVRALGISGVCVSGGPACLSRRGSTDRALLAMGLSREEADSSIRFSFSDMNTLAEIDETAEILKRAVGVIRRRSHGTEDKI